jgi:hypothetical protein
VYISRFSSFTVFSPFFFFVFQTTHKPFLDKMKRILVDRYFHLSKKSIFTKGWAKTAVKGWEKSLNTELDEVLAA